MIAVGAVDPQREGVASWNRLGEIADAHTSTITGFIAGDRTPCTRINLPALGAEAVVPLSVEQVQSIADRLWAPHKALGVLIAATGLRGGEAHGLTCSTSDEQWGMSGHASSTRCSTRSPDIGSVDSRDASPPRRSTPGRSTRQRPALTATRSGRSGTHASRATWSAAAHSCSRDPSLTT